MNILKLIFKKLILLGDMTPSSVTGKIFGSLCAISGVLIVSLPIGIISANFSKILVKEHKTKVFLNVENKMSKIRKKISFFDSENVKFSKRRST